MVYWFSIYVELGGTGSGNFGHAGRPGEVGGSGPGGGGGEKSSSDSSSSSSSSSKVLIQRHGMAEAEDMDSMVHEASGIKIYYPKGGGGGADSPGALDAEYVATSLSKFGKNCPDTIYNGTKEIVISSQSDAEQEEYIKSIGLNPKEYISAASGGDGTIVFYNNSVDDLTLAHEIGHNFATSIWGTAHPPKDSDFSFACRWEGSVTAYSKAFQKATGSWAEDFAEVASYYCNGYKSELRAQGHKFKVMEFEKLVGNFVRV